MNMNNLKSNSNRKFYKIIKPKRKLIFEITNKLENIRKRRLKICRKIKIKLQNEISKRKKGFNKIVL